MRFTTRHILASACALVLANSAAYAQVGIFDGSKDLGRPGEDPAGAGSATFDSATGTYTVIGGGSDWWNAGEFGHFVFKPVSGNFRIEANVQVVGDPIDNWFKAGVAVRNDIDNGAGNEKEVNYFSALTDPFRTDGARQSLQFRPTATANMADVTQMGPQPNDGTTRLALQRYSMGGFNFVSGYVDRGTGSWSLIGTRQAAALNDNAYAGLAMTAHRNRDAMNMPYTETTKFSNVQFSSAVNPFPDFTPIPGPSGGMGHFGVREVIDNGNLGNADQAENSLRNIGPAAKVVDYTSSMINRWDNGGRGNFGKDDDFEVVKRGLATDPAANNDDDVNHLAMVAKGTVRIPAGQGGDWTFGVNSDDSFRLVLPGKAFKSVTNGEVVPYKDGTIGIQFFGGRGAANTLGTVSLEPGDYDVQLAFHEGGGGGEVEFFAAKGAKNAFDLDFELVGAPKREYRRKAGNISSEGFTVRQFAGTTSLTQAIEAYDAFQAGTRTPDAVATAAMINYSDPQGPGANRGGTSPFPNDTPADDNNFATVAKGTLTIDEAGKYTFDVLADDSNRFRILDANGDPVPLLSTTAPLQRDTNGDGLPDAITNDGGCCSDLLGTYDLGIGDYTVEVIANEQTGGGSLVLYGAMGEWTGWDHNFQLLGANIDDTISREGLQLVPEPGAIGVLAMGALSLLGRRRRQK